MPTDRRGRARRKGKDSKYTVSVHWETRGDNRMKKKQRETIGRKRREERAEEGYIH